MRVHDSLLVFAALLSAAHAETVSIAPIRDATLLESASGSVASGSGPALFVGANGAGTLRRPLLAFDLTAALPEGAIVDSVSLRLTVSTVSSAISTDVHVHRVLADWGEGASASGGGSGAPAESSDATWLHTFFPDSFWAKAGGDFDATTLATASIADIGTYAWSDSSLTADVQRWLDDPSANFGWLLTGDEATANSAKRIDSRDAPDALAHPELVVVFHGTSALAPSTWSRTKARYGAADGSRVRGVR